jgi:oligoribonuclease NrnB/cAMP/cGMP phosphodiesterase (DHH superfamily)
MDKLKLPDLIIYHGSGCPDGLASAWCFRQAGILEDDKFHAARFNEIPPNTKGKNVVLVDFSYSKDIIEEMLKTALSIRVLDHHRSANQLLEIKQNNFSIILDMDRSGAQIAWDELFPGQSRPWFIDDIGDRDLWRWSIPDSKLSTRAMFGLGYYSNLKKFNELYGKNRDKFVNDGNILDKDDERNYSMICKHAIDCICNAQDESGLYWRVRVVECDHTKASEVGNRLVKDNRCDFSAMFRYEIVRDEWHVSLRANVSSDIDLTEIVKHLGNGGGHAKAAGMTIFGKSGKNILSIFKPVDYKYRFHLSDKELIQPNSCQDEPSQMTLLDA